MPKTLELRRLLSWTLELKECDGGPARQHQTIIVAALSIRTCHCELDGLPLLPSHVANELQFFSLFQS